MTDSKTVEEVDNTSYDSSTTSLKLKIIKDERFYYVVNRLISIFYSSTAKAIFALLIALLIWAFVPVLARRVEQEIEPIVLAFYRLCVACLCLGAVQVGQFIYAKFSTQQITQNISTTNSHYRVFWLITTAIFFALTDAAWFTSISQTTIANSALLHNLTPVFIALIGFIVLGRRFNSKFLIGGLIAVAGSAILGWSDIAYNVEHILGDSIALLSALFWALHLLLLEKVRGLDSLKTTFYCCLIGSLTLGITLLFNTNVTLYPASMTGYLIILGLGIAAILSTMLTVYAIQFLSSEFVSAAMLIDPILAAAAAWVFFSETVDLYTFASFPVILFGVYMATKNSHYPQ